MKIFIASSSKYVPKEILSCSDPIRKREISHTQGKLASLIRAVEHAGHEPFPWWNEENLKPALSLLQNMIWYAKYYDGGIFVLGEDVKTRDMKDGEITKHELDEIGSNKYMPNANVLIEAGMFSVSKGPENMMLVVDEGEYSEVKIPVDFSGRIFTYLFSDPEKDSKSLRDFISSHFSSAVPDERVDRKTFYYSTTLFNNIIDRKYEDWGTKSLYIGTESARLWSELEQSNPTGVRFLPLLLEFFEAIVDAYQDELFGIDNYVSWGSGCGFVDGLLVEKLISNPNVGSFCYVPIDINPALAFKAAAYVNQRCSMSVPFCIVEDFESNFDHISSVIEKKAHEIGKSNFFVFLGATFSNLEISEKSFLTSVKNRLMGDDDYFFLDAAIAAPEKDAESARNDELDLFKKNTKNDYIKLFMNSLCIKEGRSICRWDINAVREGLQVNELNVENGKYCHTGLGQTRVERWSCKIVPNEKEESIIMIFKKYMFDELYRYIDINFKILAYVNSSDNTGKIGQNEWKFRGNEKATAYIGPDRAYFLFRKKRDD